ncbi:glycosyltransferase BC10-like isoform X1 [Nicotiana tomentosiformis]|uniref:glycosyltransferase BC10-like isoform X1 n=1 Tax=Nicotiana tomentosiformis TaxID=4098 RepID=UPI00051AF8C6|nr:glycosyltransferase BC10-like isoform X1 [Nicotiana tomentosiformis]
MKKNSPAATAGISVRNVLWLWWKLVVIVSLTLCVLAFLKLQSYSLSDSELSSSISTSSISRRSRVVDYSGNPKVAFLFLVRRNLPLDFLWGSFFENAETGNFSIYIHSEPGFVFDESTTRSPFFYNRQLTNSTKIDLQVAWGESSMIQAEKLLLGAALDDPANQRFVLLSDSCVPLYNFSYIYNYLMASPRSFVDSFLDKKEARYNPKMSPYIPMSKWRKGSQWITLIRKHAEVVADDDAVLRVFKMFCKRRPSLEASKGKKNMKLQKQHNCIPDEHYVQTLLAMHGFEGELERRTITYTEWNESVTNMEKRGWHPITFSYADAGPVQIKRIKDINNVYYETEYRTEWCRNNSTLVPCFLFARKFSRGAAMRLLSEGVVSQFDASSIMNSTP